MSNSDGLVRIFARNITRLLPWLGFVLTLSIGGFASAAVTRDVTVSKDQSTSSISTGAFSTVSANELLLAFISTDYLSGANTTVTGVSGGGLTWTLVRRTNVQSGTSEIWRAFATSPLSNVTVAATISQSLGCSLTVMSFAGVDTTGTNGSGAIGATGTANSSRGAPTASLTTTRSGSWVMGVGNDYDNAISRTPGANQTVVHQDLTPAGDTYWVQMQSAPTAVSGTTVSINDTAPTTDRYNLSICEVLPVSSGTPQTWSISGTISPSSAGAAATVSLTGASNATISADSSGNYSLTGLQNGAYTVTPTQSGYTFNPTSQSVTITGANVASVNFTGQSSSQPTNPLGIDASVSTDGASASATISSAPVSTAAGNELLLAFVETDYLKGANTTVQSVSGGALTWVLVQRTNVQSGSSEIWRAFSASPLTNVVVTATLSQSVYSSISVTSFSGVNVTGTNGSGAIGATGTGNASRGAPTASLTTTQNGSWVVGVGNDFDNAIARTPGPGQRLVHQFLSPTGDTYWVQIQNNTTPTAGTAVTINDTAPTTDRFNLSICEILAGSGSGGSPTPPTVAMIAPAPGGVVANLLTLWASASDANGVAGVQFLLDGASLGAEVTTPPYTIIWDTSKNSSGSHLLTARARNTAGQTATSASVPLTVDNSGNPAVVGSWSSVVNIPAVAVNLVLLKNNTVLFYQDGASPAVWDYVNGTFTGVPTTANLFCSGHALLADGRVLVVGGWGGGDSDGIANAEIFDPSNNSWTAVPNMSYRRWYPTATTLSDGTIMVTAGWQSGPHVNAGIPEIYNSSTNTWTKLSSANNPFETYPFLYQLSDGRVIHVGNSEYATVTDILDLTTQTWSVVDPNIVDGASCAMYLPGKIMKAGTATDSQGSGPSAKTTYVLDTTVATPAWHQTPSMVYSRSFLNLPVLPDGTVLAIGGETDKNGGNIANAVYPAELWSPQTQTWTTMGAMHTPREYHGTAILLPDARVLVSGMGADFGNVPNEMNAEFYSPPYLFKSARPSITQAPAQISYGTNFFISTPDAANITTAVLIRTGAVTHFFDQNTRYVPVTFQQSAGGLTISAPASANFAPPGYYMLFIVDSSGVPSIAPFVQLQ
jgi:galactose oxidase-like protein/Big-like domain-containing protein/Kelch motif protein